MKQGLKENKDNLAQVEVEVDLCKMKVLDFLNSTRWVHNANTKITMIELSYYYSIVTKYNEQAGLSWGSVQAETVRLQLQV